jgi:Holliday junction resolvasome RuvABC endonuclease subunit
MRPIIGVDPSLTSTGYSGCGLNATITSKFTGVERLADISTKWASLLTTAPSNVVVVIEGYSFASRNSQAHSIGELGGVLRLTMFQMGIPFIEVPPTCRAKFATGRGNASKTEVMSSLSARTGIVWSGKGADDMADAYVLEEMGLAVQGKARHDWPKSHLEALEKVDWSAVNHGTKEADSGSE